MKALIKFLFILIAACQPSVTLAQRYTLEDLKILHKQKSYLEYLDHALDVVPSKRNKEWDEMTGEMALHYLEAKIKDTFVTKNSFIQT